MAKGISKRKYIASVGKKALFSLRIYRLAIFSYFFFQHDILIIRRCSLSSPLEVLLPPLPPFRHHLHSLHHSSIQDLLCHGNKVAMLSSGELSAHQDISPSPDIIQLEESAPHPLHADWPSMKFLVSLSQSLLDKLDASALATYAHNPEIIALRQLPSERAMKNAFLLFHASSNRCSCSVSNVQVKI